MDNQNNQPQKKNDGICVASFVCGIISLFCCNPLYLVSAAGFILGIIGLCMNKSPKWMSIMGMLISVAAVAIWIILDIILLPFTFGLSFFF